METILHQAFRRSHPRRRNPAHLLRIRMQWARAKRSRFRPNAVNKNLSSFRSYPAAPCQLEIYARRSTIGPQLGTVKGVPMSATLKLFKKAAQETWRADAATILMTKPVVVETAVAPGCPSTCEGRGNAQRSEHRENTKRSEVRRERSATEAQIHQKDWGIVQDNSNETNRFVRSNN